jgi:hypothetical protein
MTANPLGAHQVGVHTADRMVGRYASSHDVWGVPVDQAIGVTERDQRAGTPA